MGTFNWPIRIADMDRRKEVDIEATVDTGAAYTTISSRLLSDLGVSPTGKRRFMLADGRRVDMEIGLAWATIGEESVVTVVAFGEEGIPPLLGAYTLEGLGLAVDPLEQRLIPTHLIMY